MKALRHLLLGASALCAVTAVHAQALTGTLQRIKETGEIRLGHRDVSVPFSYLTDDGKPIGMFIELCDRIVAEIRAELQQEVKIVYRPMTIATFVPLLQNQSIDIGCGPATNTAERQKQVAFSNTVFVASIRALVKRDSGIARLDDLKDKTVSLTSGSTSVTLLGQYEKEKGFETRKLMNPDHAQSFLMFNTGRAQAFVMDDIFLAGQVANQPKPADYRILDDWLRVEPYGLAIRKDDPQFKALVDRTITTMFGNGEFGKLYAKWMEAPIPPKNVNLNFPMTPPLKDAIANPNDKGV